MNRLARQILTALGVLALLYLFLISIGLMGASFKMFGKDLADQIFKFTDDSPIRGLFIGILATSLVQSSSTTTSMVVGMVAGGVLSVQGAIPIIMGANVGTSVTNTLVSLGHITRRREFQRAFAASTVHDVFNLMSVLILFPLQFYTKFLGIAAEHMGKAFQNVGGLEMFNPLKAVTEPAIKFIKHHTRELIEQQNLAAIVVLVLGVVFLFISLKYLTRSLRQIVLARRAGFFERHMFGSPARGFTVGVVLTTLVQSSSVTTSVAVPLAGAGILSLRQIFPFTLGANIGTTVTAILASLAMPQLDPNAPPAAVLAPVTVAFSHLLFNICGIIVITAPPPMRAVPLRVAEWLSVLAMRRRWLPIVYVIGIFFVVPVVVIFLSR
ncbi:MAG: hypothetical protein CMJ49_13675 [Planctomycetaceae bacterium]|nr:hypothetical protein [Planctomycetaceae bacterium]